MLRETAGRQPLVLVIDDEPQIRRAVESILDVRGLRVACAADGAEALAITLDETPEVIVLDLSLPDTDGIELLRRLRSWLAVPVLVLSVRADERDKIGALEAGADDYLTKPFSAGELAARVKALLRRASGMSAAPAVIRAGELAIDLARRQVSRAGEPVALTPIEFDLLAYLASNADRVVTWGQIIEHVWGPEYAAEDSSVLRVHVSNLRKKIEAHPSVPRYILTEPRVGFRFSTR